MKLHSKFTFKKTKLLSLLTLSLLSISTYSQAMPQGNAAKGEIKTPSCRFCHGNNGIAPRADYPNLRGQQAQYLYDAMLAYQQDTRTGTMSTMMKAQLQHLNKQDLADIAAYYSQMKE